MISLKKALTAAGSSAVLALSMAGVASADANSTVDCSQGSAFANTAVCIAASSDSSTNYYLSGCGSSVNQTSIDQGQGVRADSDANGGDAGFIAEGGDGGTATATATGTQTATVGSNVDCSTHNTTVAAAASNGGRGAAVAQVDAPRGSVHAGGGAGATSGTSFASLLGLTGSVATLGAGVAMRKKGLLGL